MYPILLPEYYPITAPADINIILLQQPIFLSKLLLPVQNSRGYRLIDSDE